MRWLRQRKARNRVVLAAKMVQSGYEPDLKFKYDPDDLHELRQAVAELRTLEGAAT